MAPSAGATDLPNGELTLANVQVARPISYNVSPEHRTRKNPRGKTLADGVVAYAANGMRSGAAARAALIRRLREGSGAAMIALGLGLARRPAT
jgi:hypothetical protein